MCFQRFNHTLLHHFLLGAHKSNFDCVYCIIKEDKVADTKRLVFCRNRRWPLQNSPVTRISCHLYPPICTIRLHNTYLIRHCVCNNSCIMCGNNNLSLQSPSSVIVWLIIGCFTIALIRNNFKSMLLAELF